MDGFTFHNALYWRVPYGTTTGAVGGAEIGAHPCGSPSGGDVVHRMGDTVNKWSCSSAVGFSLYSTALETGTFSSSDVSVWPYRIAPELQGQERDANKDASGTWFLVPPAAGGVPGALVVYLARTVTAPRARPLMWNSTAGPPSTAEAVNHYQLWDYEMWWGYHQPWNVLYPGHDTYTAIRMGTYLAAAQESLYGTLNATTNAYSGTTLLGEAIPRVSVPISRDALAAH
jgi:hypothetical protein